MGKGGITKGCRGAVGMDASAAGGVEAPAAPPKLRRTQRVRHTARTDAPAPAAASAPLSAAEQLIESLGTPEQLRATIKLASQEIIAASAAVANHDYQHPDDYMFDRDDQGYRVLPEYEGRYDDAVEKWEAKKVELLKTKMAAENKRHQAERELTMVDGFAPETAAHHLGGPGREVVLEEDGRYATVRLANGNAVGMGWREMHTRSNNNFLYPGEHQGSLVTEAMVSVAGRDNHPNGAIIEHHDLASMKRLLDAVEAGQFTVEEDGRIPYLDYDRG